MADALDLCYKKEHVDTSVISGGNSDSSPLVSKLRESNRIAIGVGVNGSRSGLPIGNCDEFLYYADFAQRKKPCKAPAKKTAGKKGARASPSVGDQKRKPGIWPLEPTNLRLKSVAKGRTSGAR